MKHQVDEQECIRFNWKRDNCKGKEYSRAELVNLMKELGYPIAQQFLTCITRGVNPPIVRIERGKYRFPKEPVHILRLQKVWDDYGMVGRKRTKQVEISEMAVKEAIKMLKNAGYKILKPVTKYEEVL